MEAPTNRLSVFCLAAALLVFPPVERAHAQPLPPDVVELTNGGMLRGTIVENLPGDHVTIQLATGAIRTFPAAEVARVEAATQPTPAPQAPEDPPPTASPIQQQPSTVRLAVESNSEDFMLHRVTRTTAMGEDAFELLCTIPCTVDIETGTYFFGLSRSQDPPRRWPTPFSIDEDTTLALDTANRGDERLVGWLMIAGGVVVGGSIFVGSLAYYSIGRGSWEINDPLAFTGMVFGGLVVLVGTIAGAVFAGMQDHVDLRTGSLRF